MGAERNQRMIAGVSVIALGLVLWWLQRTEGFGPLQEALVPYLATLGIETSTDKVLITSGSQGALDALGRVLVEVQAGGPERSSGRDVEEPPGARAVRGERSVPQRAGIGQSGGNETARDHVRGAGDVCPRPSPPDTAVRGGQRAAPVLEAVVGE